MELHLINEQTDLPLQSFLKKLREFVPELLDFLGVSCDELSITFVTAGEIKKLHKQFFNDPSFTDCITLPMDDPDSVGYRVLGEIFVCPKAAIEYVSQNDEDPYKETLLYVIHGILHLIGYDDIKPADRKKMRAMEKKCIDFVLGK